MKVLYEKVFDFRNFRSRWKPHLFISVALFHVGRPVGRKTIAWVTFEVQKASCLAARRPRTDFAKFLLFFSIDAPG